MALLTCSDVTFSYEGIPVLTDVNFALEAGSYLCIVGENGSGKSTLIKGLLHLKNPCSNRSSKEECPLLLESFLWFSSVISGRWM